MLCRSDSCKRNPKYVDEARVTRVTGFVLDERAEDTADDAVNFATIDVLRPTFGRLFETPAT